MVTKRTMFLTFVGATFAAVAIALSGEWESSGIASMSSGDWESSGIASVPESNNFKANKLANSGDGD